MKQLSEILGDIEVLELTGSQEMTINHIQYDSRKISPGDLFVAIKGETIDGHEFIDAAVEQGALAVVYDSTIREIPVPSFRVDNSRKALALMSAAYYDYPARGMTLIGITGTNGKTSTAHLIDNILQAGGYLTGLLGTISYRTGMDEQPAKWTTPESLELHQYLRTMYDHGIRHSIMEISSHALEQYRVEGLEFRLGIFTNLSQDHLDYHRSMERYSRAKERLFTQVDPDKGEKIINGDDPLGKRIAEINHRPVLFYSVHSGKADVFPDAVHFSQDGIRATLMCPGGSVTINSPMIGEHNLYNIMAAVCAGISLKIPYAKIEQGIEKTAVVAGRLEPVSAGQPFMVLVDYAHTPDAMEKAIAAVRPLVKGKLIVLFGCGGDRDSDKRPKMGRIAEERADLAILTSDNPRTEDPQKIINDVIIGLRDRKKIEIYLDRAEAIYRALDVAQVDDWVLLLGKGHETYQVLGTKKIDFDDREIARGYLLKKYQN